MTQSLTQGWKGGTLPVLLYFGEGVGAWHMLDVGLVRNKKSWVTSCLVGHMILCDFLPSS